MRKIVAATSLAVLLAAGTVRSEPAFRLSYPDGVPRAEILGDWRHSRYSVWRAEATQGAYARITEAEVLCVGPCFADDFGAVPGRTYLYRFDLVLGDGSLASFGPYAATISETLARPLRAALTPNPGAGPSRLSLFLAGPPGGSIAAEAALFDLQGRRVARLFAGPLASGHTRSQWSGRADDGRLLAPDVYLLGLSTSDGRRAVSRVVRGH